MSPLLINARALATNRLFAVDGHVTGADPEVLKGWGHLITDKPFEGGGGHHSDSGVY